METKDKKEVVSYLIETHDFVIQIAEEFGFEFMDEEKYDDIMYDYYFKFI